jgi:hypothetical protein
MASEAARLCSVFSGVFPSELGVLVLPGLLLLHRVRLLLGASGASSALGSSMVCLGAMVSTSFDDCFARRLLGAPRAICLCILRSLLFSICGRAGCSQRRVCLSSLSSFHVLSLIKKKKPKS